MNETRVASINPGAPDFLAPQTMKMATVGDHRIAVVRTEAGVFALDNACPHQGYGLVTGSLGCDSSGDAAITCQWHNWKFRVSDGVCTQGEENVLTHSVRTDDAGTVRVTVTVKSPEERKAELWPSLAGAIARNYVGQIGRDTVRLLDAGATPAEVMESALVATMSRTEDGVGHEMAMAADCLTLAEEWTDDDRILPLVNGLSGLSEETRGRDEVTTPPPVSGDLVQLIEAEQLEPAMAAAAWLAQPGADQARTRQAFVRAAAQHHLGYGHGAIYTQKAFELIERIGWQMAPHLLPQLARSLVLMTREDTLPYMRKAQRAIDQIDLTELATVERTITSVDPAIVSQLLEADDAPIAEAVVAVADGHGVEGLIDSVSLASAHRLLRYDENQERQGESSFNWLSITHALTHARAVRWAWNHSPGPDSARQALYAVWLLFDAGRAERRGVPALDVADLPPVDPRRDFRAWAYDLQRRSLDDAAGSFIVLAHLVKTSQAALEESITLGSSVPLQAADRFVHGQRRERFVGRAVSESLSFVRTGKPPVR
ncbi:MAG: Rieske (2Fe-2S) protein [Acidimicrobiales bacterium]|nr:Rieske (2Fe-2S) protein [Acidimicrobiales bacterium]